VKRLLLVGLFLAGCNHLFYHPDDRVYLTPDKLNLSYTEHRLPVGGEELALWHMPPSAPDQKVVVVHFHGNGQNMTSHFMYTGWMTKAGFDVVTFDYEGYGRSTGKPTRAGLVTDGLAVLDWVARQPSLKGKRIVVFGQSLGGAVAVPVTALWQNGLVSLLVVESTFDSYRRIARGVLSSFWLSWPLQWPLSFLVSDGYSPDEYVGRLTMPFLVIHGEGDRVVPFAFGQALFEQARMRDKAFWKLDDSRHTSAFADDDSVYRERFVRYVCKRLACTSPGVTDKSE
jgi:fermentation-respiration switch protein FrsA (DUF1100 family)